MNIVLIVNYGMHKSGEMIDLPVAEAWRLIKLDCAVAVPEPISAVVELPKPEPSKTLVKKSVGKKAGKKLIPPPTLPHLRPKSGRK